MGYLVERAGIVAKLFFAIRLAAHRLPASMAVAALITCTLFSTATGIIGAVVTLMGLLAWPAMVKAGYDKKFASGVICAGGCLGILIPPSIMLIVYSVIAQLSPLRLFAAAIFPGLLLAGLYIGYAVFRAWMDPSIAPKPKAEDLPPRSEILKEVLVSFVPLFGLIMLVLGTILAGIATPAEAAAAGAFGAILLSWFYKTLKWQSFKESVFLTAKTTAMIMWLFHWFLDLFIRIFLFRWSRGIRAFLYIYKYNYLAIFNNYTNNNFSFRMASGMDRNFNYFCSNIFTIIRSI
jgi:tripartite ATP-independent transporter DctM subunit